MTKEFCTKVASIAEKRYHKNQQKVWEELIKAVAALKDAEKHLLRAHIAMECTQWSEFKTANVREWALWCEQAGEGSRNFLQLVSALLDYDDPFSSERVSSCD